MRNRRQPFNPWPPFVDAMVLTFAAFFIIAVAALAKQRTAVQRLEQSQAELDKLRAAKARVDGRLKALAQASSLEVDDGKVILQGEVLFDSGSPDLKPDSKTFIASLGKPLSDILQAEPDQMVMIAGHTDDIPTREGGRFNSNRELSAARALSVAQALKVPNDRVLTAGFGEYHPRVANSDESARQKNRRIEVLLVPLKAVSQQ